MRVLMVTNNFTPYSGGVVSSIVTSTRQLAKLGHEFLIVTLDFLDAPANEPNVIRVSCPVRFMYKQQHVAIPLRAKKDIATIVSKFKPDIIHSHHPVILGTIARLVAKKKEIPVVFTYHTMYEAYAHHLPVPTVVSHPIIQRAVRSYCNKVDGIIVPSDPIERCLKTQKISRPTVVIPSGIDEIFLQPYVAKTTASSGPLQLLYVGRFSKEKNVPFLFGVLDLLRARALPFKATFIGYGGDTDALHALAYEQYRFLKDQVAFIHKPPKSVIADHYRSADLFLFSSHTDTQALVLAEAMAGSTPVIAVHGPGQEAIIREGENGFIVATAQGMADAIVRVAQNPALLATLQKGAWQTAQEYAPEKTVAKLVQFYTDIIQNYPIKKS